MLTPQAQDLLNRAGRAGITGDWEQVEQIAQEAQGMLDEDDDWLGCVMVLISLIRVCRVGGRQSMAGRYLEILRRIVVGRLGPEQQVREALTAYSAALFNRDTGYDKDARWMFHKAIACLERAGNRYRLAGDEATARRCRLLAEEVAAQARAGPRSRVSGLRGGLGSVLFGGLMGDLFRPRRRRSREQSQAQPPPEMVQEPEAVQPTAVSQAPDAGASEVEEEEPCSASFTRDEEGKVEITPPASPPEPLIAGRPGIISDLRSEGKSARVVGGEEGAIAGPDRDGAERCP